MSFSDLIRNLRSNASLDFEIASKLDDAENNTILLGKKHLKMSLWKMILEIILGLVVVLLIWHIVGWIYNKYYASVLLFPMPVEVFQDLGELLFGGRKLFTFSMWEHISASLQRWAWGFAIGAIIALIIGFVMSINEVIHGLMMIPINVLQMIPGLAWLPVVIILFGFGNMSAIFIVGVVVVAPVAINVSNGLRNVPKVNKRVAKMSGLSKWDTLLEVMIPFSALDIINGLRIGLGSSWRMIVASEMVVGVMRGIGFTLKNATDTLDYADAFACIIIICAIGVIVDKFVFEYVERYVRRKTGLEGY